MTTSDGGARIGAASFGIGLDLAQLTRDLDAAEALVRSRAQRIQGTISAIPVGGGGGSRGGFSPSRATPAAGAAVAGGGAAVAPWVQTLYDAQISAGKSDADARASIRRATGLLPGEMAGLRTAGGAALAPSFSAPNGTPASALRGGSTARGGGNGGRGFNGLDARTPDTTLRLAGALFGVQLGISGAVGLARQLHQAIVASAESAVRLEQGVRSVGIAFGSAGRGLTGAGATEFAQNPLTKGTTGEFLNAAAGLGPIASQFQLTTQQVKELVTTEGVLARLHGVELPQAAQVLQQVLRGNIDAGESLNLNLLDEYGRLKDVGLSFDELVQSVGRARAEQILLSTVQADVNRQLANSKANSDAASASFDRLGKAWDDFRNKAAQDARGPVSGAANFAVAVLTGQPLAPTPGPPSTAAGPQASVTVPGQGSVGLPGTGTTTAVYVPGQGWIQVQGGPGGSFAPNDPGKAAIDRAIAAQTAPQLANELAGAPQAGRPQGPAAPLTPGQIRDRITSQATEQANRAGIQARLAQSQLDTLGGQSDLRRLSVQQSINELAQTRLDIEGRLAPVLLEQQRVQDAITLTTRENLTLTEATLRAQQAAYPSANAAFALSYQQQRIRLQAQVQQSRAIRGLAPAAGIPGIPELFGQARDLALIAPEVDLAALQAQYPADVAARAQAQAATSRQLAAIPAQQRLQQLQDVLIPLGQARSAAQAAADAIERSLQGADLLSGPDRIKAQQDLANARIQEADAAGKIAQAQVDAGGGGINATATVNINGLTDVQAAVQAVLDAFRPQIINAINAAASNPRPPAGPPTDRGNP